MTKVCKNVIIWPQWGCLKCKTAEYILLAPIFDPQAQQSSCSLTVSLFPPWTPGRFPTCHVQIYNSSNPTLSSTQPRECRCRKSYENMVRVGHAVSSNIDNDKLNLYSRRTSALQPNRVKCHNAQNRVQIFIKTDVWPSPGQRHVCSPPESSPINPSVGDLQMILGD